MNDNIRFFEYVDNFAKTESVRSIPIFVSKLDFHPLVTIVIPTYNRADLLKIALDSALNQINFNLYEVIVVDNNPERNDDTEKMLLKYDNSILSYFKNEKNIGMVNNWNRCFDLANTDAVLILHDDDVLYEHSLYTLWNLWENNRFIKYLHPEFDVLKGDDKYHFGYGINWGRKVLKKISYGDFCRGCMSGPPSGCMISKECLEKIGGFNDELYPTADYCFNAFFNNVYGIYVCRFSLFAYRLAVNQSLNVETIKSFLKNDNLFRLFLLERIFVPHFLAKYYVNQTLREDISYYSTYYSNGANLITEEEKIDTNILLEKIFSKLVKGYLKMLKIFGL